MDHSVNHHKSQAKEKGPVRITIVTVSDSRTEDDDVNGAYLKEKISDAGHQLINYHLIKDEPEQVLAVLEDATKTETQIILFNGGTGISTRDRTFDALSQKFEKILTGFGELFRMLSYEQVGSAAMLSRAIAGTYKNKIIFSTPGSPKAVQLAWEKLIAPEMAHLAWEISR